MADEGLWSSEALHLLVEDWRAADRGLFVRAGKGRKDRLAFIEPTTTRALKAWFGTASAARARGVALRGQGRAAAQAPPPGADPSPPEFEGRAASAPAAASPRATPLRGDLLAGGPA
jgi:integrase